MTWQFEPFNDATAPDEGYYTLEAGPLYAVIEPASKTVAVWANLDGNAVLANHTGFDSLAEAQQTALDLLASTLQDWLADIRQATGAALPDAYLSADQLTPLVIETQTGSQIIAVREQRFRLTTTPPTLTLWTSAGWQEVVTWPDPPDPDAVYRFINHWLAVETGGAR